MTKYYIMILKGMSTMYFLYKYYNSGHISDDTYIWKLFSSNTSVALKNAGPWTVFNVFRNILLKFLKI